MTVPLALLSSHERRGSRIDGRRVRKQQQQQPRQQSITNVNDHDSSSSNGKKNNTKKAPSSAPVIASSPTLTTAKTTLTPTTAQRPPSPTTTPRTPAATKLPLERRVQTPNQTLGVNHTTLAIPAIKRNPCPQSLVCVVHTKTTFRPIVIQRTQRLRRLILKRYRLCGHRPPALW